MAAPQISMVLAHHFEVVPVATLSGLSAKLDFFAIPADVASIGSDPARLGELQERIDLFALLVDARTGISKEMIVIWQHFQERQFPRVMIVQGIEFSESDFDDIVLIGNRVLEQFATPFLVLHDDIGQPTALISLEDNLVHDYSGSQANRYSADSELVDLISDFQDEYLELHKEMGETGFAEGIFAIAIPVGSQKPFGIPELNSIIEALAKR